jgi:hypothetical protein
MHQRDRIARDVGGQKWPKWQDGAEPRWRPWFNDIE